MAQEQRVMEANGPIVAELLNVRAEIARLLRYSSYAAYTLEISMTKTAADVEQFLTDLTNDLTPRAKKEMAVLTDLKRTYTADPAAVVNSWDLEYYMGKLEEEQRLDKDGLMNYFPMEAVVKNTISIYQDLLGLSIRQIDCTSVWAADITCWKTYDAASGELLGQFYLDLVPREGKLEFPTTYTLQKRSGIKPDVKKAVVAIVAQLGRPVEIQVEGWEKSLLPFDEVKALFQEFGQAMHHMCSKANYARLSGINVEWDFVNLPSLTVENLIWQRDMLKRLSSHHSSGAALPDNLIDDMIATRNLNRALRTLNQVFDSTMDFVLHSPGEVSPAGYNSSLIAQARNALIRDQSGLINVGAMYSWLRPALTLVAEIPNTNQGASWQSLIRGDQQKYYGQLWAQVYSYDLTRMFASGSFQQVGQKFRDTILAPSGSKSAHNMIKDFLGRPPSDDGFMA